jgi:hypothetical protein
VDLQNKRAIKLPENPSADSGDGYTHLEKWLHALANEVEGQAASSTP